MVGTREESATGLLAEKTVHAHIQGTTIGFVQSNVNRSSRSGVEYDLHLELPNGVSVSSPSAGQAGSGQGASRQEDRARSGFVSSLPPWPIARFMSIRSSRQQPCQDQTCRRQPSGGGKASWLPGFQPEIMITDGAEISLRAELDAEDTMFFGWEGATEEQKVSRERGTNSGLWTEAPGRAGDDSVHRHRWFNQTETGIGRP